MTSQQLANVAEFLGLLFVAATLVFLITRIRGTITYRCAVGLALAAAFIIVWVNLAVGIIGDEDNPANLMYVGALAVGIIGAIIARFRPHGMARALFATALAHVLIAVIVLVAGLGVPGRPGPGVILVFNGFLVALFVGSALLFRHAARQQPPAGARLEDSGR